MQKKPNNLRAHDQKSFSAKGRKDFTVRKHSFSAIVIYKYLFALILIVGGTSYVVAMNSLVGSAVLVVTGIFLYIYARHVEHYKKLLTTTEFLNALFSSILADDNKFNMIINNESGEIVYLNGGFQKTFPEMLGADKRQLRTLLGAYEVAEAETILTSLKSAKKASIVTQTKTGADKKSASVTWLVQPVARPSGFSFIRGQ